MGGSVWRRTIAHAVALVVAGLVGVALLSAGPALAYERWIHDGIPPSTSPDSCAVCHEGGTSDSSCTSFCHRGFRTTPGATVDGRFPQTCWSCHAPGADTDALSSSSAACSQECHLYNAFTSAYTISGGHAVEPHLGASEPYGVCLDCHSTSLGYRTPGDSPHHDGVDSSSPGCTDCHNGTYAGAQATHDGAACEDCHVGMNLPPRPATCTTCHAAATFGGQDCRSCHADAIHDTTPDTGSCTSCHTGYQKHAGEASCTSCHTNAPAFHHGTATPATKGCRSCHAMKHDGAKVAAKRCADCHKGKAPAAKPRAQHSSSVTRKFVCGGCHGKKLHAKSAGASTTCRTCHKGKYHAGQSRPGSSVCTSSCHRTASRHAVGFRCVNCHRHAIHDPTPG